MKDKSYKLEPDNFEGEDICVACVRLLSIESFPSSTCGTYSKEGQAYRQVAGYCPITNRYASWRSDKPVVKATKKRVGQQKQR